jgi:ubiquinone/menaquinone biosynthesis C-methylase UbiE
MLTHTLNRRASKQTVTGYALSYTDSEQERLIRQAAMIGPVTERFFRQAGIGLGQRVLDLGSGMGDVAMLVAQLVGPSGEVVGIERDANSIARAQARVAEAGLHNVSFVNTDVNNVTDDQPFDAAVGRLILQFLPDPIGVLRSVCRLVRPGGVLAFQEPSLASLFALGARLPLWSQVHRVIRETFLRSGVNPETGLALHRIFHEVGLPAPIMHLEMPLGSDTDFLRWAPDLFNSLRSSAEQHNVSLDELGDLATLPDRLCGEITTANAVVSVVPLVSAWSRKSTSSTEGAQC